MLRIIFALLLAEFGACTIFSAQAQAPIYFPAEDFGDVNKSFEESSQNQATLEILMSNTDVFEDVVMLAADDPNRMIGRSVAMLDLLVQLPDGRKYNPTCTATRISADYLITNYHCVPGKSFTVLSVKARFGYLDRDNATGTLYAVERTVVEADPALDYAILRFSERPPVELYPPLPFSARDAGARESLFLLHHPAGFPQKLTRIRCQAGSPPVDTRNRLVHHCDTLGGSSGTAILALRDRAFVALHHSGVPDPVRPRNLGTPASRLVANSAVLRRIISEGEAASGAGRGAEEGSTGSTNPAMVSETDAKTAASAGYAAFVRQDYEEAFLQWKAACDGGSANGCTSLGVLYQQGLGVTQDYERARELYQKGCDGGSANGCTSLGVLYQQGLGVTQDYERARELYQKGCDGGSANGCTSLGLLYKQGLGGTQDYERARDLYKQGCDGGEVAGCSGLGVLYQQGLGVTQDYERARDLYKQGCDGGSAGGCTNLGHLYKQGLGGTQDYERARDLHKQGCDGGEVAGCSGLGDSIYRGLGGAEDKAEGALLVRKGCAAGYEWGCDWLDSRGLSR